MVFEKAKCFQVLSKTGAVKVLTEHEYYNRMNREGYTVGYIDSKHICFCGHAFLKRSQLDKILSLVPEVSRSEKK
jgi:hypothetical protein